MWLLHFNSNNTELKKFLCTWFGEVCYSCSLTVLPGSAWVVLIYVLQRNFFTSVRLHRGRSDGEGRNNPNHLGWFIGWLHAMAALDRNHERTPVCLPACSTPACQSICAHAFNSPKRGYYHATTHRWFTACNPPEEGIDFFRWLDDCAVMRSHRCRK